jgi:hypothetical protein
MVPGEKEEDAAMHYFFFLLSFDKKNICPFKPVSPG